MLDDSIKSVGLSLCDFLILPDVHPEHGSIFANASHDPFCAIMPFTFARACFRTLIPAHPILKCQVNAVGVSAFGRREVAAWSMSSMASFSGRLMQVGGSHGVES
jgi:hypothetical protein